MPTNLQDRNKQPLRAGGNCADKMIEVHGSNRGEQINIGADKGNNPAGNGFNCGGNAHEGVSKEKHDQAKDSGKKFVGGKAAGAAPVIPSEVQISERRHGAGNNPDGGHEHQTKGMSHISSSIDRD